MTEHYDVIIIGTGPGGGTLAHALAPSGKRILLLERGDYLPREKDNWDPDVGVHRRPVHFAGHLVRRYGKPFQPQVHYFVGGATKMYGAALYRLRPEDFGEIQHVDGMSPAWPLELRRLGALVYQGRVAVSGARRARRGPDRAAALVEDVPVAGGLHEPRIQETLR